MPHLILVSVLIAILGLAFTATGFKRLIQRRYVQAGGLEICGLLFLIVAASAFLLASNLYTYNRLVYEQAIAEVTFQKLSGQQYRVDIQSLDSDYQQVIDLDGDEWRLDAQLLSWQGVASLIASDTSYRLHTISARYVGINEEQHQPVIVPLLKKRALIDNETFDLWQFANRHLGGLYWLDTEYRSMVFLSMTDGAKYRVAISRTGLIARPANDQARNAVSQWIGL